MRKVKLQMQMTINGYVAQPNGENDWMTGIRLTKLSRL